MRLSDKFALILAAIVAAAVVASSAVFLNIEYSLLNRAEIQSREAMIESASGIIRESRLAKDPLILVDFLRLLGREHSEIGRCRIWMNGRWRNVQGVGTNLKREDAVVLEISSTGAPGATRDSLEAQIWLSQAAIETRMASARKALLKKMETVCVVLILLGLIISLPLGRGLSRRVKIIESAVARIGEGDAKAKIPNLGQDEIGRLSKNINAMAERLSEIDRLKKEFVASVTHELRSPLSAIESYINRMLAGQTLAEEDRQGLSRVLNNVNRLNHFVSNLLQMAKIERGKLDFIPKNVPLAPLIEDSALFFAPLAQKAGIRLDCKIERSIGEIRIDPDLISHVLANLISNALKFTRAGGSIVVCLEKRGQWAECSVQDTGIGLAEKDAKRIFAPFERIRNPLKATGVGLGLAISKSIIDMHRGEIGVASVLNQGSRFYFRLPMGK